MKLTWRKSTDNRYVAELTPGVIIYVERPRSWKRIDCWTWRATLFGNPHLRTAYVGQDLGTAIEAASEAAFRLLKKMGQRHLGCAHD